MGSRYGAGWRFPERTARRWPVPPHARPPAAAGGRRRGRGPAGRDQHALRLPPRRALLPRGRPASGTRLSRPAAAHPAAGAGDGRALRRLAGRAAAAVRAGRRRGGAADRADRPRVRRRARAQLLAAACIAVSSPRWSRVTCVDGHVRPARLDGAVLAAGPRAARWRRPVWLAAGAVAGVALRTRRCRRSCSPACSPASCSSGPRRRCDRGGRGRGAARPGRPGAPYLVWQAAHGLPAAGALRAIAAGARARASRGTAFVPFQLLLVSPLLVPVWVAGWCGCPRDPALRPWRAFGSAYLLLAAVYLLTGGKPYYLAGLYPVLLAAGAIAPRLAGAGRGARTGCWAQRSRCPRRWARCSCCRCCRRGSLGPMVAVNHDAGETVGWPAFVRPRSRRSGTGCPAERATGVVLTRNYGEAGAVDRYGPARGLPPAYSGHNGYGDWGPPPGAAGPVIVVGYGGDSVRGRRSARASRGPPSTTASAWTTTSRARRSGSVAPRPGPGPSSPT